eukprot:scaffold164_cov340-Pinguiococcus_pyrenoidosus.AAC.7
MGAHCRRICAWGTLRSATFSRKPIHGGGPTCRRGSPAQVSGSLTAHSRKAPTGSFKRARSRRGPANDNGRTLRLSLEAICVAPTRQPRHHSRLDTRLNEDFVGAIVGDEAPQLTCKEAGPAMCPDCNLNQRFGAGFQGPSNGCAQDVWRPG